jgi:hypothetical protein
VFLLVDGFPSSARRGYLLIWDIPADGKHRFQDKHVKMLLIQRLLESRWFTQIGKKYVDAFKAESGIITVLNITSYIMRSNENLG